MANLREIKRNRMKAKIFSRLKQAYSALGLGDEILQGRADSLAKTGLVTDDNIDLIVSVQKDELESLQKLNDSRVLNALAKQQAKFEEEARRKAEEAKAAEEKAKAEKEAEEKAKAEARAKAEADAKAKAEAEAKAAEKEKTEAEQAKEEAAKLAELEKAKAIPEDFMTLYKADKERMAAQKAEFDTVLKAMDERYEKQRQLYEEQQRQLLDNIGKLQESNTALRQNYDNLAKEREEAAKVKAAEERREFILNKAKELGIPDWRINEGFSIPADAENEAIVESLTTVSNNISTQLLPQNGKSFSMATSGPTKEDIANFAKAIVK